MFEDLFSSSRGPGVIGLLLGMVVLAGFGGLGLAVFDGRFNGDNANSISSEVKKQEELIKRLEGNLVSLESARKNQKAWDRLREELELVQRQVGTRSEELTQTAVAVKEAEAAIGAVKVEWESYKDHYRAAERGRAKGEKMDELKTADGDVYKRVEIKEVTESQIAISHVDGLKRIDFEKLPPGIQDRFQFDPKKAVAEKEKEQDDEIERTVDAEVFKMLKRARLLDREVANKKDDIAKAKRDIGGHENKIAVNTRQKIPALREEAARYMELHRVAQAKGNPSSHLSKVNAKNKAATKLVAENSGHQSGIGRLRGAISKFESEIRTHEDEARKLRTDAKARLEKLKAEQAEKVKEEKEAAEAGGGE